MVEAVCLFWRSFTSPSTHFRSLWRRCFRFWWRGWGKRAFTRLWDSTMGLRCLTIVATRGRYKCPMRRGGHWYPQRAYTKKQWLNVILTHYKWIFSPFFIFFFAYVSIFLIMSPLSPSLYRDDCWNQHVRIVSTGVIKVEASPSFLYPDSWARFPLISVKWNTKMCRPEI